MVFKVFITKAEDCYIADIPSLKHCFAGGETIEEAIDNLKEALEGTLESMKARNIPIIDDSNVLEVTLQVPDSIGTGQGLQLLSAA